MEFAMKVKHIITNNAKDTLWLLLLSISINTVAQKIELQSVSYNPELGEQWPNENKCFFEGFEPIFTTDSSPKIWSLYISTDEGDHKVLETSERVSTWSLKINDIPFLSIPNKTKFLIENDSSLYWKGFVSISNAPNESLLDCYPVTFNLLPSSPKISEIELIYESYDWENDCFNNSKLCFEVNAKRLDLCLVYNTETILPGDLFYFSYGQECTEKTDEGVHVEIDDAQWNQYIKIFARNKFGSVAYGDTLCTTDYIKDEMILQRIKQMETSILPININSDIELSWNGKNLELNQISNIRNIILYDGAGKINKTFIPRSRIDLSTIPTGIYLIACYMKNSKVITKKIIKR